MTTEPHDSGTSPPPRRDPFSVAMGAALVLLLCSVLYIWGSWKVPFYEKGEPREGLVAWEIWHTGEWILPLRAGTQIPSKPPLFHWIAALAALAAGVFNEFTVRLPSTLLAAVGVLLTYLAGARLWGIVAGIAAAVVLATSPEWWRAATSARVDMTLTFFMLCTFLYFYFLYKSGGGLAKSLLLAFFAGLATLAKGPVGAALPGIAALLFLWRKGDFAFVKRLHLPIAIPFGLIVAGSWYLLALRQGGEQFFLRQIVHEIIGTPLGGAGHNHNIFYYVPALIAGMAPWSLFFPALILFIYQRRRRLAEEELLYPLAWFAAVFVVLSLALGKRSVYILPLYPAAALLFGAWWKQLSDELLAATVWVKAAVYAIAAVFLFAGLILAAQALGWDPLGIAASHLRPQSREGLAQVAAMMSDYQMLLVYAAVLTVLTAVFMVRWAWKNSWDAVLALLVEILVLYLVFIQNTFHPAFAANYSFRPFMARVREKTPAATPIVFYDGANKAAAFYARVYLPSFLPLARPAKPPYYLLIWDDEWEALGNKTGLARLDASENTGWNGSQRLLLVSVGPGADLRLPEAVDEPADEGGEP